MLQDMFPQSISITPSDPKLRSEDTLGGETFKNSPTQSQASNITDLTSNNSRSNLNNSPPHTPNNRPQQFPDEMLDYFDFMQNEVPLSLSSQEGHNILPSFYLDRSSSVANRSLSDKDIRDRLETISSHNSHTLTSSPVSHSKMVISSPSSHRAVTPSPVSHKVVSNPPRGIVTSSSSHRIDSVSTPTPKPNNNNNSNSNSNSTPNHNVNHNAIHNSKPANQNVSSVQAHTVSGPLSVKKIPVHFETQLPPLPSQLPTPSPAPLPQLQPQKSRFPSKSNSKPDQASTVTTSSTSSGDKLVNSLNRLRRLNSSIAIEVTLTKDYPEFGQPLNKESLLREYHPGEIITGSIQIQNTSSRPIKYELVLGTFEGYATIPVRNNRHSKEIIKRQFLRIVDPGASSHQYHVPNANVETPSIASYDETDGTEYGLTDDKILESGKKYKQFFRFKIPEQLFDDSCSHALSEHKNKLPPSLGLDSKAAVNGDIASDEVFLNKALGYGRCELPGSPIMMNDQAHKGYSISYCMHISVISIEKYSDLNPGYNVLPSKNQEYCMMNDKKYYIRCVTTNRDYSFPSVSSTNEQATGSQLKELENKCIKEKEKLRTGNSRKFAASRENSEAFPRENSELIDLTSDLVDLDNYSSITSTSDGDSRNVSKLRDEISSSDEDSTRMFDIKSTANEFQSEMIVPLKPKKRLIKFGSSKLVSRVGTLGVKCTIAKDARIPYIIPRTLRRFATSNLEEQSQLYDSVCTKTVKLSLLFKPYSGQTKPPEVITIKPLLKSILLSSPFPIPITFSSKSLTRGGEFTKPRLLSIRGTFLQHLQDMKTISSRTKRGVDKQIFYDANSLAHIKRSDDKLPVFQFQTLKPHWKQYQSPTDLHTNQNKVNYVTTVEIPLEFNQLTTKNLTVLPNFDSCYFVKRYFLSFGFDLKGYSVGHGVELANSHVHGGVNVDGLGFTDKDALDVPINVIAL